MGTISSFGQLAMQPDIETYMEFIAGSAVIVVDYNHEHRQWQVEYDDGTFVKFDNEQGAVNFALEKLRS